MTNFEKTQLTDLGAALVGKHGLDVCFTRVETGCGTYVSGEKVGGAATLKSKVQDIAISNAARVSEAISEVKFLISNQELAQEYLLTEIGVYALDPDAGEILYAICYATPENSQKILAYNGRFPFSAIISLKIEISAGAEVRFETAGGYALAEDFVRQQEELDGLRNELACNLLYLPDNVNGNSAGSAVWRDGKFSCNIPSEDIAVWSGEISLPEGGCAYPASSDSADVIVKYQFHGVDGVEGQAAEYEVEISNGAVLPEGAVVTEYRLERKEGESRIVADIWPMISPGKRPAGEYVPYTGDGRKMNRCVAFAIKAVEKLHNFCLEKFVAKDNVANNLVTTNAGYALDARQGKALDDKITGINGSLSQICSDYLNINLPYHSAYIIFIRVGQYCIAHIYHFVAGLSWDTEPSGIRIPEKYRPSGTVDFPNVTYLVKLHADGVIWLQGSDDPDMPRVKEYGFVMYGCAN